MSSGYQTPNIKQITLPRICPVLSVRNSLKYLPKKTSTFLNLNKEGVIDHLEVYSGVLEFKKWFCENKMQIVLWEQTTQEVYYENLINVDLTQNLTSVSMVCITIDTSFRLVSELFSRMNKRINIHN